MTTSCLRQGVQGHNVASLGERRLLEILGRGMSRENSPFSATGRKSCDKRGGVAREKRRTPTQVVHISPPDEGTQWEVIGP